MLHAIYQPGKMTNQPSAQNKQGELSKNSLRIKVLLEKLRTKLKNFVVRDDRGNLVGRLKSVHLDELRRLNLVISEGEIEASHLFLLRSNHIKQVDYTNHTIFLDINQTDIQDLAEYKRLPTREMQFSESSKEASEGQFSQANDANSYAEQMPAPSESVNNLNLTDNEENLTDDSLSDVVEEEVIRLLEERLVVNLNKRKVGEVIVRKEVETRMVEVPVQYEKLIVEQVGSEQKIIAEIDLSQPDISGLEIPATVRSDSEKQPTVNQPTVTGVFTSPKTASLLLDAIARQKNHTCQMVRVEIVLKDTEDQKTYQEWFDRCSGT